MNRPWIILGAGAVAVIVLMLGAPRRTSDPAFNQTMPGETEAPESANSTIIESTRPKAVVGQHESNAPNKLFGQLLTSTATNIDWMTQIETVRDAEESDREKAAHLLALFPSLPAEGRSEIIPELAALTRDAAYANLGNVLTNALAEEDVLAVLFTDLLDRPESIQLPLLLQLAKNPNHPKAEDAREMLAVLLGEDAGADWNAWAKKISERLVNPSE